MQKLNLVYTGRFLDSWAKIKKDDDAAAIVQAGDYESERRTREEVQYRGGPMFHADAVGLPLVKKTLEALNIVPSPLLTACIDANMSLTKYWSKYGGDVLKKAGPPRRRNGSPGRAKM